MKHVAVAVALASLAGSGIATAQVVQEPIGARLEYQVSLPGGTWGSSVTINPGERVEWRAVISFTSTQNAVALGRIYYQPIFSNVDNTGTGSEQDQLGTWRNNGSSGQGNTTLQQGLLSLAEGADSSELASYGRVHYGFTSRSTTAGSSGPLIGHRHSGASDGAPSGEWMRVAGSNNTTWYPENVGGTVPLRNRSLRQ